jgi:glycosyltransferase involved in cell wall biosynthesis
VKILHFITSLKIGGAETVLYNLLEHWSRRRENSHAVLYIHGGPYVRRIQELGIPVYQLKGLISPYDPVAWQRLKKIVKKIQPDVIHSSLWSANVMARVISRQTKIPLVCDLHGNCRHYGKLRNVLTRFAKCIGRAKAIVAVSPSVKTSFVGMIGGSEKIFLIRNGVPVESIRELGQKKIVDRDVLMINDDDFVIGSVGRLHKIKRYDILIRAVAQCGKKMILVLVGDGPERAALEKLAADLGVRARFVGEQENPYPYYHLFNCFSLSSQTEGLSIALLEALAFGLPIVMTNETKEHDVIVDEINGFVVQMTHCNNNHHSVNGLISAFEKLYSDDNIASSMRKKNRFLVEECFCIDKVAFQYENIYKKISHCAN